MKLTIFLLTAGFLNVCAKGVSQNVTFSGKEVSLESVFLSIKQQTGFVFMYKEPVIKSSKPVSVSVENVPLEQFLKEIFKYQPLKYNIRGKSIFVSSAVAGSSDRQPNTSEADVLSLIDTLITVRGRIVNEKGEPAIASVIVKGTKRGTTSDQNGNFEIGNVNHSAVLIISATNIDTREISVNNQSSLNIAVKMRVGEEEIVTVSTGYWTTEKRKSVGNIAKITAKEIENQPVTSPLLALQGRVAGVEIIPTTGTPGTSVSIRIRGQNSIRRPGVGDGSDGNLPLYVIDGVPISSERLSSLSAPNSLARNGFDPLAGLNPDNIESIEILKDGDATGIYGSRGANGVILITTKRGKANGQTNLEAKIYRGVGKLVKEIKMLDTKQYLVMRKEAFANDGLDYTDPNIWYLTLDLAAWDTTRYTNWQKELLGESSEILDANIHLSGGNDRTSFGFGAAYHKETLMFPGDFAYQRFTGDFNVNHYSRDQRFSVSFVTNYGVNKHKIFDSSPLMSYAFYVPPTAPALYNADGTLNWQPSPLTGGSSTFANPLSYFLTTHTRQAYNLNTQASARYNILPALSLRLNAGYSRLDQKELLPVPISSLDPTDIYNPRLGRLLQNSGQRSTWILEPQINFAKDINDHNFSALAGLTFYNATGDDESFNATGYRSDALLRSLAGAATVVTTTSSSEYRFNSLYARLGYDYKGKYLVNINLRRDGSSRFGPANRFGNFGSAGAGWMFSEEKFFKDNNTFLSTGKIRASYGATGNDGIGDAKYIKKYMQAITYGGVTTLVPSNLYNPDYQWESTSKFEVGTELGFFKDKIMLEVSWFSNRTRDQLIQYTLPNTAGFEAVLQNFPALVGNSGLELALLTRQFNSKNFRWSTSFNISFVDNKLISFPGIELSPYALVYQVGEALNLAYGYVSNGVDPQTGLYAFEDINHDGQVSYSDRTFIGSINSKYFGGLTNNFSYRSFDLSFLFQFSKKSAYAVPLTVIPGNSGNQLPEVMNRWQKPGDITAIQRFTVWDQDAYDAYSRYSESNAVVKDVSFIRLKTLSLSWRFPKSILGKVKADQASVFIQGQNLLTITRFTGWDPETLSFVPPLRMLSGGFQIRF